MLIGLRICRFYSSMTQGPTIKDVNLVKKQEQTTNVLGRLTFKNGQLINQVSQSKRRDHLRVIGGIIN